MLVMQHDQQRTRLHLQQQFQASLIAQPGLKWHALIVAGHRTHESRHRWHEAGPVWGSAQHSQLTVDDQTTMFYPSYTDIQGFT